MSCVYVKEKVLEKSVTYIANILIALFFLYVFEVGSAGDRIYHDLSSYLAPAVGIKESIGLPYLNYYDIKPPGLIFFLLPWISTFGYSLKSLIFFDLILNTLLIYLFFKIIKKISTPQISYIFFLYGLTLAGAMEQFKMVLMSETIGLIFLFGSFNLILMNKKNKMNWPLAGFFLAIASQIKEVYLFSSASIIFYIIIAEEDKIKKIISFLLGWTFAIAILISILIYTKTLDAYLEVLIFKSEIFHFPTIKSSAKMTLEIFQVFQPTSWLFILIPILMFQKGQPLISQLKGLYFFQGKKLLLMLLLLVCMIFNFTYQGKYPSSHYLVSIWFIYIICLAGWAAFYTSYLSEMNVSFFINKKLLNSILLALNLFMIHQISYGLNHINENLKSNTKRIIESKEVLDKYLTANKFLAGGDCVQQAYGWDAGATYIYTKTRPCSKYFLSNLIVNEKMKKDNIQEIINSPPKVIIYSKIDADLDVLEFEANIFPWGRVIDECYKSTRNPEVFFSEMNSMQRRSCILKQIN